jgi:hypothetical protein
VLVNPDHYNLNESLIAEKMQRERNERRARARAEKARQPSEADRKAAAKVLGHVDPLGRPCDHHNVRMEELSWRPRCVDCGLYLRAARINENTSGGGWVAE